MMTEEMWATLSEADLEFVKCVDQNRLHIELARLGNGRAIIREPVYGLRNRFVMWEGLISRMDNDWNGDYYLAVEYVNDLISRTELEEVVLTAPMQTRSKMASLLNRMDEIFTRNTVFDGGVELASWCGNMKSDVNPELWCRKPRKIPWSG